MGHRYCMTRMRAHTHICMYVCMYKVYICIYVCMYVCMYVCTYVRTYVRMYVCMYRYIYICMYVRMYVCMYTNHLFIYLYMSICLPWFQWQKNMTCVLLQTKWKTCLGSRTVFLSSMKFLFILWWNDLKHRLNLFRPLKMCQTYVSNRATISYLVLGILFLLNMSLQFLLILMSPFFVSPRCGSPYAVCIYIYVYTYR